MEANNNSLFVTLLLKLKYLASEIVLLCLFFVGKEDEVYTVRPKIGKSFIDSFRGIQMLSEIRITFIAVGMFYFQ